MRHYDVFRDGKVHVLAEQCATCIFRPGNLMNLEPGRVKSMADTAVRENGSIPCHEYMDTKTPAICRGLFNLDWVPLLQIARRLGYIEYMATGVGS